MKIEEKITFYEEGNRLEIFYTIPKSPERFSQHIFSFNLSLLAGNELRNTIDQRINEARSEIAKLQHSGRALKAAKDLFEHFAIWYPYPDPHMVENRNYNPVNETAQLREGYCETMNKATAMKKDPAIFKDYENPVPLVEQQAA